MTIFRWTSVKLRSAAASSASEPVRAIGPQAPGVGVEVCAGCALPLKRRGPHGECLRCVVRLALEEEATDKDEGATPAKGTDHAAIPARYGHFEIQRGFDGLPAELGSGAMATTYRALDTVLRLPVALKVIGQQMARDPGARARFLREARAAARLRHPNVASVTHYGEEAGECFYAMELVEGETLAERVGRVGAFTPEQTLEIGLQVARALAAAEALGVVHRDIKPSNLMLVGQPVAQGSPKAGELHVKVIDWGLAKAVSADDTLLGIDHTRDAFVGTPAFASPEQFSQKRGRRIDTRSDIYSLGVTLWYLLCGRMPFVGNSLDAIHAGQKRLPLTQLVAARVPGCLTDALRRMLAFRPTDRPQSARELLDLLRQCQDQCTSATGPAFEEPRPRRLRTATAWMLVFLCTAGAGWWTWQHLTAPPTVPGEKPSVAVLPFENLGPDPAGSYFTTGIQDKINDDLARVAALDVIRADHTRSLAPGQRDLAKISRELGVRYLLEGAVRRTDREVEISVRLVDARDPAHPWSLHRTGRPGEVFAMQSALTRAAAESLRVNLTEAEKIAIDRPPTSDLAAYDLYLRTHDRVASIHDSREQEYRYLTETAIPSLEQAVALDPQFLLAYCDLVYDYNQVAGYESGKGQVEAVAKHHEQALAALARARQVQPDAGEVHLAQADQYFAQHGPFDAALQDLAAARRQMPNSAAVERLSGEINRFVGRWEEAVRCFARAAVLEPRNPIYHRDLAATYAHLRRYEEAEREWKEVFARKPPGSDVSSQIRRAIDRLEERADLAALQAVIDRAAATENIPAETLLTARLVTAVYTHDAARTVALARDVPADGLVWGLHRLPGAWFEALAARMRGDYPAARDAFLRARPVLEKLYLSNADNGWYLSQLGVIDAGLGRREEAVRAAIRACELCPLDKYADTLPTVASNLAIVYAWTGQPELACQTLRPWLDRPAGANRVKQPTYGDLRLNPAWDPLRNRPDFAALVEYLVPKSAEPMSR